MTSVYVERFESERVEKLLKVTPGELYNQVYAEEGGDAPDSIEYLATVQRWLQRVYDNGSVWESEYTRSGGVGRRYVKGFGLQSCERKLRGYLQEGITHDYDMRNAHPTLLLHMVRTMRVLEGVDTTYLEAYVTKRDAILEQHELSKLDVLKAMNTDRLYRVTGWLKEFHNSLKPIKRVLYKKHGDMTKKTKNAESSVLNKLICVEEDRVLQKVEAGLKERGVSVSVLMFDGLMCETEGLVPMLNEMTAAEGVVWDVKEHTPFEYTGPSERGGCESYASVKREFEKTHFIVRNPLTYVEVSRVGDEEVIYRKNKAQFTNTYEAMTCMQERYDVETKKYKGIRCSFLSVWYKDANRKEYERFDFVPPPLVCPAGVYNLFTGFVYESYVEEADDDVSIFLNHIRLLAGDEKTEEVFDYIVNYLAHLIQTPGVQPRASMLFKSIEGIGKNILFDSFGKYILGSKYVLSTARAECIIGKFNQLDRKFLVCYDEASGKDTYQAESMIKGLITAPAIEWEQKGKDAVVLANYMRLLFFSNNENPVKIGPTDRRFQVIECGQQKPSAEYFGKLVEAFETPAKCVGFVKYLKGRDLSGWTPANNRVLTEFYEALASKNITMYDKFMRAYVGTLSKGKVHRVRGGALYERFETWCGSKQYVVSTNTMFGREVRKYAGVTKTKAKGVSVYVFEYETLVEALYARRVISEDERGELLCTED